MMNRIELIARFFEDVARKDDRDLKIAPSLKRLPREENSWQGWLRDAKKLSQLLEENQTQND